MIRTILRDGLSLRVDDAGGTGRPVIFQHGLGGSAAQTAEAFPEDPSLRRVTLECRGHGSSPSGPTSLALFAGDVASLADRLGPPVVLGGISMGAALALRIAAKRPELARALILVRPAWIAEAAPANMAPVAEVAALLMRLPPEEARAGFLSSATAFRLRAEAPDNLESLLGYFAPEGAEARATLLAAVAADDPSVTEADIARTDVPALICGCADDLIHPLGMAERLAGLLPQARFLRLPSKCRDRAGHIAALRVSIATFIEEL